MSVAPNNKIRVGRLFSMSQGFDIILCRVVKMGADGWINYEYFDEDGIWKPTHGWIDTNVCDFITVHPDPKEMLLERLKRDR